MAHSFWYPAQWGELGGWVTGTATMLLAGVTAVGLHRERKARQKQQGQIDEQREVMRKQSALLTAQLRTHNAAQAKKITVQAHSGEVDLPPDGPNIYRMVRVKNGSERPIRNVNGLWFREERLDLFSFFLSMGTSKLPMPEIAVKVGLLPSLGGVAFADKGAPPFAVLREGKSADLVFPIKKTDPVPDLFSAFFEDDDGLLWEIDQAQNVKLRMAQEPVPTPRPKAHWWDRLKFRRQDANSLD